MRIAKQIHAIFFAVILAALPQLGFGQNEFYDEIFGPDGKIRPHYAKVYAEFLQLTPDDLNRIRALTTRDFQGDNALSPLPRLILESEAEQVAKGVDQRARALTAFLKDHYSGNKTYLKEGIVPEFVIERVLQRSGTKAFDGAIDPSKVDFSFFYGPDVVRDKSGVWRVYEDNTTYVGGFGDLIRSRESLERRAPQMMAAVEPVNRPEEFYDKLAERYKELAAERGGIPLLVTLPMTEQADNEDQRVRKIFQDRGIDFVTTGTDRRLVVEADGAYLVEPGGNRQKVGYVILSAEHRDIDYSRPDVYSKAIIDFAKEHLSMYESWNKPKTGLRGEDLRWWNYGQTIPKDERDRVISRLKFALKARGSAREVDFDLLELIMKYEVHVQMEVNDYARRSIKGLTEAVLAGRVGINNAPGIDMIDDKELYLYVEEFIRHYLGEEPIIRNVRTGSFAKKSANGRSFTQDAAVFQEVFKNPKTYVVKGVSGRGGDSVYILRNKTAAEIAKVQSLVKAAPQDFIWQEYSPPSRHGPDIGDHRPLTQVFGDRRIVSQTWWLRGSPFGGSGLVNISSKDGHVVPMIVVRDWAGACGELSRRANP